MREVFLTLFQNFETKLKIYFGLTIGAVLLDIIEFFVQLVRFGRPGAVS